MGPRTPDAALSAGRAKYFVALANHHCNFDCWNSKYQPWNSVNIGPKKDIVGIGQDGAVTGSLRRVGP